MKHQGKTTGDSDYDSLDEDGKDTSVRTKFKIFHIHINAQHANHAGGSVQALT